MDLRQIIPLPIHGDEEPEIPRLGVIQSSIKVTDTPLLAAGLFIKLRKIIDPLLNIHIFEPLAKFWNLGGQRKPAVRFPTDRGFT